MAQVTLKEEPIIRKITSRQVMVGKFYYLYVKGFDPQIVRGIYAAGGRFIHTLSTGYTNPTSYWDREEHHLEEIPSGEIIIKFP